MQMRAFTIIMNAWKSAFSMGYPGIESNKHSLDESANIRGTERSKSDLTEHMTTTQANALSVRDPWSLVPPLGAGTIWFSPPAGSAARAAPPAMPPRIAAPTATSAR